MNDDSHIHKYSGEKESGGFNWKFSPQQNCIINQNLFWNSMSFDII